MKVSQAIDEAKKQYNQIMDATKSLAGPAAMAALQGPLKTLNESLQKGQDSLAPLKEKIKVIVDAANKRVPAMTDKEKETMNGMVKAMTDDFEKGMKDVKAELDNDQKTIPTRAAASGVNTPNRGSSGFPLLDTFLKIIEALATGDMSKLQEAVNGQSTQAAPAQGAAPAQPAAPAAPAAPKPAEKPVTEAAPVAPASPASPAAPKPAEKPAAEAAPEKAKPKETRTPATNGMDDAPADEIDLIELTAQRLEAEGKTPKEVSEGVQGVKNQIAGLQSAAGPDAAHDMVTTELASEKGMKAERGKAVDGLRAEIEKEVKLTNPKLAGNKEAVTKIVEGKVTEALAGGATTKEIGDMTKDAAAKAGALEKFKDSVMKVAEANPLIKDKVAFVDRTMQTVGKAVAEKPVSEILEAVSDNKDKAIDTAKRFADIAAKTFKDVKAPDMTLAVENLKGGNIIGALGDGLKAGTDSLKSVGNAMEDALKKFQDQTKDLTTISLGGGQTVSLTKMGQMSPGTAGGDIDASIDKKKDGAALA